MYKISYSTKFQRKFKKFKKQDLELFRDLEERLKINPFDPSLKTHKLQGSLSDVYSCRLNYKNRVLFILLIEEIILVYDVGSHDQVY
jgi:addiction module RelE/StbE family toxin